MSTQYEDVPGVPERATIYVVTTGHYSEYAIEGVFDDKGLAEEFIRLFLRSSDSAQIEEFQANPGVFEARAGFRAYAVYMLRDGSLAMQPSECSYHIEYPKAEVVPPEVTARWSSIYRGASVLCCNCWARDPQHAIKIANDRRAALIALGQWPEDGRGA